MKHVSLQAGDTSLLHLILHFKTRMHNAKIHATHDRKMVPLQRKIGFFKDTQHSLGNRDILPGIVEAFMQLFQGYANMCHYCFSWIVCTYIYDPLPDDCDVVTWLHSIRTTYIIHKETLKQNI